MKFNNEVQKSENTCIEVWTTWTKPPPSIQKFIEFLLSVASYGFILSIFQFASDLDIWKSLNDEVIYELKFQSLEKSPPFVVYRSWFGICCSIALWIIASIFLLIFTYRWDLLIENRTKRICFHIATLLLCETLTAFLVIVNLQLILPDADSNFSRLALYLLEILTFVSYMSLNSINHLMLIYHTFYAIEVEQLPYMTKLRVVFGALRMILLIGSILILILSNPFEDIFKYLGTFVLASLSSAFAFLGARRAFIGKEGDVQCRWKSFVKYSSRMDNFMLFAAIITLLAHLQCWVFRGPAEVDNSISFATFLFMLTQFFLFSDFRDYCLKCMIDEESKEDSDKDWDDEGELRHCFESVVKNAKEECLAWMHSLKLNGNNFTV